MIVVDADVGGRIINIHFHGAKLMACRHDAQTLANLLIDILGKLHEDDLVANKATLLRKSYHLEAK